MLTGKVLITGGAGYLGRGILRQAQFERWPAQFTIMSRDEAKHVKVRQRYPGVNIIRGDVSDDVSWLTRLFMGHDTIIHAGANKLVDIGEATAFEIVKNNIVGSDHVARAAINAGVETVVGISSDKAVQPVNVYGMSKAVMERLFQEADTLSDTRFICARYGNVVGSTISVVLYFRQQLAEQGYINVTVPEMTRFYMGIEQAVNIIVYSANHAQHGAVTIAKMQAMQLADVARLALGRGKDDEAPITADNRVHIVGARPGEKIHESLLHEQESVRIDHELPDYWELRPATEKGKHKPFAIVSNKPPGGWMTPEKMQLLIDDAVNV